MAIRRRAALHARHSSEYASQRHLPERSDPCRVIFKRDPATASPSAAWQCRHGAVRAMARTQLHGNAGVGGTPTLWHGRKSPRAAHRQPKETGMTNTARRGLPENRKKSAAEIPYTQRPPRQRQKARHTRAAGEKHKTGCEPNAGEEIVGEHSGGCRHQLFAFVQKV